MKKSPVTEMVRSFAAVNGTISKKEARNSLNITRNQSAVAFDNLIRQGHLRQISRGVYQFIDRVEKPPMEVTDKIWRAMKVSGTFSAGEIAKLAGSTRSYVYKRFRVYRADGLVKEAGVRRTHGSGQEKVWRLTLKGKEKAKNPRVNTWVPDPLNRATVNLNRLVCSGVAIRDKAAALEALAQVEIIRNGLSLVVEEA